MHPPTDPSPTPFLCQVSFVCDTYNYYAAQRSTSPAEGMHSFPLPADSTPAGDRQNGAAEQISTGKSVVKHPFLSLKGSIPLPRLELNTAKAQVAVAGALLTSNGGSEHAAERPLTSRGVKCTQAAYGVARPWGDPPGEPQSVPPASAGLTIELISPAFSLDADTLAEAASTESGPVEAAFRRASAGLGVHSSALKLYELWEVAPGAGFSPGVRRLAVSVTGSRASPSQPPSVHQVHTLVCTVYCTVCFIRSAFTTS